MSDEKGKTFDEELAELEADEAKRGMALDLEAKQRRHEELTLSKRFAAELGPRGREFELVNLEFGVFGVKVPDPLKYKMYIEKVGNGDGQESERTHQFVASCLIYPSADSFNAVGSKRAGVVAHVANAACTLAGLLEKKRLGK